VLISAALRQGPHFKFATVASPGNDVRFERFGIWTPYFSLQKQTYYHLCYLVGVRG